MHDPRIKTKLITKANGLFADMSVSAVVAGITAIIVGYAGPTVIIFQVAENASLTDSQVVSWLWAYSVGSALVTIYTSWKTRQPQIMAWSTPGIAFLVFALKDHNFSDAVGAFLVSNFIILLIGYFGWFQKVMALVPMSTAAALNAGILLPFALQGLEGWKVEPQIVTLMIVTFFVVRFFSPRWAVASVLLVGGIICIVMGKTQIEEFKFAFATPVFTTPTFDLGTILDIAIPLTVLALTGQYLPGLAVLKSYGYKPDNNKIVKQCGFVSLLFAPFGCHNINPSSMIAGIVSGPEAHKNPSKRYWAAIVAGGVYLIFGTLATSFVLLFSSLPSEAIMALAGLSLLAAIAHSLNTAMKEEVDDILTPTVVFIVAISGLEILSIGSTFWAIVIGLVLFIVQRFKEKK